MTRFNSRTTTSSTVVLAAVVVMVGFMPTSALASGPIDPTDPSMIARVDDRPDPLSVQQREWRQQALQDILKGAAAAKTNGNVHQVASGQYVELARDGEDPVWTVLGEFADFAHNSIAEPDRSVDNTTIWTPDFNRDYYMDMLFAEGDGATSMRNFYIEQSSNRYAVYGDVTDWISLPGNACDYDDGDPGPGNAYAVWQFLQDSIDGWYQAQIDAGMTPAGIDDYLSGFDVWDRYDYDGDGDFDEPDGYIDHAQFVHAGEGNEAGGGALGDCAIWSHSWRTYWWLPVGPSFNPSGGIQIGDSSYWVAKYTIQPENGGVGVFAHEYGHDLGLPDLYDYTGYGMNSNGFWSLMGDGSWLSQSDDDIGSAPVHLGAWDKFQLGWLNYEVAFAGYKSEHKLGPAETNTKQAQGLFVVLPDKEIITPVFDPYSGLFSYYSGLGNRIDNWMYRSFSLGAGSSLTAMANAQIELDWDYAYLVVSTDGGATWQNVQTNLSTMDDPNSQNFGHGITGDSGGWVPLTADLSAYTGDVLLGFRYWTDAYVVEPGFAVDDIQITGYPLDDGESGQGEWTFEGFSLSEGNAYQYFFNAYVAEFRQYRGFDRGLGYAYQFAYTYDPVLYNWVDRFPYQDGLLISYWDTSFTNNNVYAHCAEGRCGGLLLPVDAHPDIMFHADGWIYGSRVQSYDATFGLEPTDPISLHLYGSPSSHPSLPAVPIFDDNLSYYDPLIPFFSVITPQTGTQIRVKSVSAHGSFMQVEVRPSK